MITSIDTSVLIAIAKHETGAEAWMDVLVEARGGGGRYFPRLRVLKPA